jgi:pseudaminic acid biosynthesis-associated methylase
MNEQQDFWARVYAEEYIAKNNTFDKALGCEAWRKMLAKAGPIRSILECGCNIGRNIRFLDEVEPKASKSIIEISEPAFDFVSRQHRLFHAHKGAIETSDFGGELFDLVFTTGVLIHIHPDDLLKNMEVMFRHSQRYVLIGEYFNRTPVMLEYRGEKNKLFKCDFGKLFIDNFQVNLIDYGFLWGWIYDDAGFDDVTWWLFEKQG